MATVGAIPTQFWVLSSPNKTILSKSPPKSLKSPLLNTSLSLTFSPLLLTQKHFSPTFALSSSSVGSTEYAEERTTKVKFRKSLSLPGCSTSLSLIGTGYREKIFGILGVKVYAVGFYTNQTIFTQLKSWKGRSAAQVQHDRSIFDTIFQAPTEKSLQIVLVRDVDGKNFWAAVDEAVSPRIKSPTKEDESALSTFRKLFQSLSIKKGTFVYLTWLNPSKIIVSVSSDEIPSRVDATIESLNVTSALFDVFLGAGTVSPSLKASVSDNLAVALK